jgi:hypothetical protein
VLGALDIERRLESRLSDLGAVVSGALADALDLGPAQRSRIEALPLPQLQDLAAPIASGLEARIAIRIDEFAATPEFQGLLVEGTEVAHTKAVALLRGDVDRLPNLEVAAGEVRLNLVPIVARVLEDLVDQGLGAIGIEEIPLIDPFEDPEASLDRLATALDADLPADFGQLTVMSEAEFAALQSAARLADQLVWALVLLSVVLLAATIVVAPRRRRVLVQLGLGIGAATVITVWLLRGTEEAIAGTAATPQGRAALALLTEATVDSLRSATDVVLATSIGIAVVAYLLGRPPWLRRVTASASRGSGVQRFVVRFHDALRIGVVAGGVLLLLLLSGLQLATVLVVAGAVLLALWGLDAVRARAPDLSADADVGDGEAISTGDVAGADDLRTDPGGEGEADGPDRPVVGLPQA